MDEFKVPFSKPAPKVTKTENESVSKEIARTIETENETKFTENLQITAETTEDYKKPVGTYKEPKWSHPPPNEIEYSFEVLKSGQIIEEIKQLQTKAFWLFGRFPDNDIVMAHPTISRYHAVLQYRPLTNVNDDEAEESQKNKIEEGWYIYDLGSTHGTFVNKMRLPVKTYIRMKVGFMLKLGASSRNYILHGPEFDEEPESELTMSELKELRIKQLKEKRLEEEMQEKKREEEGISWGISEDADTDNDLSVNPYAITNNEELYLDDPKKTLRGFFEREGLLLEYKCDEMSVGNFVCRVELPIDDPHGRPIVAEVLLKGKKKECVLQCAMEACRILDRHGVLRQSHHEPLKKHVKADSDDDDDFLDRTGDIERKKMRKAIANQSVSVTYEDLIKQEDELLKKISDVNKNIEKYQNLSKRIKESSKNQNDDLDSFMENLSDEHASFDKTEIRRLRTKLQQLSNDHSKLQRLIKIAKPINLPLLQDVNISATATSHKTHALPLFGKRDKSRFLVKPVEPLPKTTIVTEIISNDEIKDVDEVPVGSPKSEKSDKDIKLATEIATEEKDIKPPKIRRTESHTPKTVESISENHNTVCKSAEPSEDTNNTISVNDTDIANSKKKRTRLRVRSKRENVDIDDFENLEESEKYSAWLPPENQSGDGKTLLNDKFGY